MNTLENPMSESDTVAVLESQVRRHGKPDARVSRRPLDNGAARFQLSPLFRAFDDGKTDPVLQRAARIEELRLSIDWGENARRYMIQTNERSITDGLENALETLGAMLIAHSAPGLAALSGRRKCTG